MTTYTYSVSQTHTQTYTKPQTTTLQLIQRTTPDDAEAPSSAVVSICGPTRTLVRPDGFYGLSGRVVRARRTRTPVRVVRGQRVGGDWMLAREEVEWSALRPGDLIKINVGEEVEG